MDLDPENPDQWAVTDRVIGRSVELGLNFFVLKYSCWASCDKMFDVFADSQSWI